MWPTWGSPGSCRPQVGPTLAPRTLLSAVLIKWPSDEKNGQAQTITKHTKVRTVSLIICLMHNCILCYSRELDTFICVCVSKPVPWWRHQMETFSALLALCAGIHRSPVNSPHKGQWLGNFMFSLICAWINGWVNNHRAGDLRRHRADYDVTVMQNKTVAIYVMSGHSL